MTYFDRSAQEAASSLGTDMQKGLSEAEAERRLAEYGENKLEEKKKKPLIVRFLEQFKDAMIIILLIAAVISFGVACYQVFGTGEGDPIEFVEPILIVFIVILNAVMGLVQESKAEKALEALKNMSAPHAKVLRDGKEEIIAASELVPGDIIFLEAGDFVPADARLLESVNLKSEESALTGESVPAEKNVTAQAKPWLRARGCRRRWGRSRTFSRARRRRAPLFSRSSPSSGRISALRRCSPASSCSSSAHVCSSIGSTSS